LISLYFALPNQLQVHTVGHDLEKGQKHGLEQFPAGLPVILNEVKGQTNSPREKPTRRCITILSANIIPAGNVLESLPSLNLNLSNNTRTGYLKVFEVLAKVDKLL